MNTPHSKRGQFITLEGIEGVGKSTHLTYIQQWLNHRGIDTVTTREPGGCVIAERIRAIFLEPLTEIMTAETELLLLFAGRAQHLASVILPALHAGKWVICDRFTDASYAYQGGGRFIPTERIQTLETWVHGDLQPDLTLLFDAPVEVALARMQQRGKTDRIEAENHAFFTRVRAAYLARAQKANRYQIIDATPSIEQVQQQLDHVLTKFIQA